MLYALVGVLYSVIVPFGEPPDEGAHYAYIRYLLEEHRLPEQSFSADRNEVKEGHHPPAYYALVAVLTGWFAPYQPYHQYLNPYLPIGRDDPQAVQQFLHPIQERFPWRGPLLAAHIARLVSIAMGCLSLLLTFRIAASISSGSKWLPLLAAGTFAFIPQLTYISAAINNDNGAILAGALLTWQMMRLLQPLSPARHTREVALLGLLWGCGILCKVSLLSMLPAIAGSLLLGEEYGNRRPILKRAVLNGVLVLCTAGLVSGWWLWRNLQLYGDPIAWNVWMSTYSEFARKLPISWHYIGRFLWDQFTSFWGKFGWGRVMLPIGLYVLLLLVTLAGLCGLFRHLLRHRCNGTVESRRMTVLSLIAGGFLVSTWRLGLSQDTVAAQGRFIFPALPAIATLLSTGWSAWWPQEKRERGCRVLLCGPMVLSICVVLCLLLPVHTPPARAELPLTAQPVAQAILGGWWEVVGWHASAPVIGREWSLTLYWRAYRPLTDEARKLAPYRYIRLLTPDGQVLAGCDGIPTAGRFPPPAWSPDVVVADKVRLRIGEQVEPGLANVLVGLQLESRETENAPVTVGQVMLRRPGRPPSPPCVTGIRIGPWARLIGYGLTQIESNVVRLDLYWRMESKEAIPADYHVFVHVIDGRTSGLVAQADAPPCQGRCPTSLWVRGDLWVDKHYITVSEESISASTPLLVKVGWYSLATGERVMAFGADGTELNDAQIVLADLAQFYAGQPCAQHR
jgi:hypothetical protein